MPKGGSKPKISSVKDSLGISMCVRDQALESRFEPTCGAHLSSLKQWCKVTRRRNKHAADEETSRAKTEARAIVEVGLSSRHFALHRTYIIAFKNDYVIFQIHLYNEIQIQHCHVGMMGQQK